MILSGLKTLLETGELLTTPGSLRYSGRLSLSLAEMTAVPPTPRRHRPAPAIRSAGSPWNDERDGAARTRAGAL